MIATFPVRTPTLPPATHTNCYLLGHRRLTLVDPASPWTEEQERLEAHLRGLEAEGAVVERVFLTHHHNDHVGGANRIRQVFGVPVLAHPVTRDLLAGQIQIDALVEEGDRVETDTGSWRALFTPGHAPGHLCLHHEESGDLIAGDMVAGVGTIVLNPPEGDLALYLASLERLKTLDPARLLPAHGPPIDDAIGLLDQYINHRNMRTDQVRAALATESDAGRLPAAPIALVPHIYPDLPKPFWPLAARQVLCHLQWLAARDEVLIKGDGRWSPGGGDA